MIFKARIRKGSSIENQWRSNRRLRANLGIVMFHLQGSFNAGYYVSETLSAYQVEAIKGHGDVELESMTVEPTEPESSEPANQETPPPANPELAPPADPEPPPPAPNDGAAGLETAVAALEQK